MFTLPQGCSAKRQIILDKTTVVHLFIYALWLNLVYLLRRDNDEKANDFAGTDKDAADCLRL